MNFGNSLYRLAMEYVLYVLEVSFPLVHRRDCYYTVPFSGTPAKINTNILSLFKKNVNVII